MNEYYVYGLIDPRTNSIFYIGKGKGKRVFQHLKEKQEINSNTEKLKIIEEIQSLNLEVGHILICENLCEESSFLLEKILINRIGRKIFDEGNLTNIVPGGKWQKESPMFVEESEIPSNENIKASFPNLIPVLELYPHIAKKFEGLQCPKNLSDNNLYVYDNNGNKIHTWDISYFIKIFGLSAALSLINVIKHNTEPVYAWNRIWSKSNFDKLKDISNIPFQDFDILDIQFIEKINKTLLSNEPKIIKSFYSNGNIKAEINISYDEILLKYFYSNGNSKHETLTNDKQLNGDFKCWFENGQIKEEVKYIKNKIISKSTYYESGNKESLDLYGDDIDPITSKSWYESGQLHFEINDDGSTFSYSKSGAILSKTIKHGDSRNGGYTMIFELSENGNIKKETKNYYKDRILHGYVKTFYETGEIKREEDYTNGYDTKIIKTFNKNGEFTIK